MGLVMVTKKTLVVFFAFLFTVFASAAASVANAKTIYVSRSGNNNNPGTESQPVATPNKAVEIASDGDTIYLRAGTYTITQRIWIGRDGITLSSYPGERAVIEGGTSDSSTNPQSLIIIVSNNCTVQDLELKGGVYYGVKIDLDGNSSTTGNTIRRCYIHHTGRDAVKTLNADNLLIEDNEIGNTGLRESNAEGIDSIGSVGVTIRRNYVHDTASSGIYLKGGARNGLIERCRVVNAGNSGILFGQDTDPEYMRDGTPFEALNCVGRNNIVINTVGAGLGTYAGNNIQFLNNTVIDAAKVNHASLYIVTNNSDQGSRQVTFKNNLVVQFSSRPMFHILNSDVPVADSNLYYRPSGGTYKFSRETSDTFNSWQSFADWQSGLGLDRNSFVSDPQLDAASLYKPSSSSPVVDRGEALGNVSTDYSGASRPQGRSHDIGAHERGGTAPAPPPTNLPPRVTVTASATNGLAPLPVAFTSVASDPDGAVASYSWAFGDGGTSTQASPSYTYQAAGSYTARVTVTDNRGATASATVLVNVTTPSSNRPPQVRVSASTTVGTAPVNVRFTTTASDPDGQVVSYRWEFGDGGTSSLQSPSYTFQRGGSFTAKVTVRDNAGATSTAGVVINVSDGKGNTTRNIVWKNVVNARVSGNTITKTSDVRWGNSGASSSETIQSGDGFFQFTALETESERMVGLSSSDPDQHYKSITYAIHLNTGRAFFVYERGLRIGYFGDFNTNDTFKVAVESGKVKYYRNGKVFYTSAVSPTYPLMADSALMGTAATVANAIIGGSAISGTSAGAAPVVKVLAPNSGEAIKGNSKFDITWDVLGTDIWRQDIHYSLDGGETWQELASMLPGSTASYSWTVPNTKSSKARIRVVSYGAGELNAQDDCDQNFIIKKVKVKRKKNAQVSE